MTFPNIDGTELPSLDGYNSKAFTLNMARSAPPHSAVLVLQAKSNAIYIPLNELSYTLRTDLRG